MRAILFYKKLKKVISESCLSDNILNVYCNMFLEYLDQIIKDKILHEQVKLTQMTILFEGFYRLIPEEYSLKSTLAQIRSNRWKNHYGTPTITFLLTYHLEIEQSQALFHHLDNPMFISVRPWDIRKKLNLVMDDINWIMVNQVSKFNIEMPMKEEKTGEFIKTHNPSGGFTTTPCDPFSKKFIEYASDIAKNGGKVLEIGAAFGAATLEALAKGVTVFCNDIDANNLAVVRSRYLRKTKIQHFSLTGDVNKLVLVPGSFPEELSELPKNYFDAILICRVLHFFKGEKIEKSLKQLSACLKPGGKLFVVCETPFLMNWKKFIPEYKKRVSDGLKWPGEIKNPADYESSGRVASLPTFVHWITKEILERSLNKSQLDIEHLSYINRRDQFPSDLLLDGRESVGAIAIKL